jgi:glucose-1-phosphate thymidylyltransferase
MLTASRGPANLRLVMRGLVLAGGTGSRLWPVTRAVSKQLLPVYDKPMIYYPLSTLVIAGISEILIVTTPDDRVLFERLLGDGSQLGLRLRYAVQERPGGIAQAPLLAADFIGDEPVALILGDNIFHGAGLARHLQQQVEVRGARIFACLVADPGAYGVVEIERGGSVVAIEEKPERPRSPYAVPGLYFYDSRVVELARGLLPSARGELEITALNQCYLRDEELHVTVLDRDTAWLDMGTFESLVQAAEFVRVIEERQDLKIGCVEEAVWRAGLIDDAQLRRLAAPLVASGYGSYLLRLLDCPQSGLLVPHGAPGSRGDQLRPGAARRLGPRPLRGRPSRGGLCAAPPAHRAAGELLLVRAPGPRLPGPGGARQRVLAVEGHRRVRRCRLRQPAAPPA